MFSEALLAIVPLIMGTQTCSVNDRRLQDIKKQTYVIQQIVDKTNTHTFRFTEPQNKLKDYAMLVLMQDSRAVFERVMSSDLRDGNILMLRYISTDGLVLCAIIKKNGDCLQWINANGDLVDTDLDSNKSVLMHYAKANKLSVDLDRIGYPIAEKVTKELKAINVPKSCKYLNYSSDKIFRKIYTELILTGKFTVCGTLEFNPDYSIVYNSEQFKLLSPDDYYFLAWKVDEKWENAVLKLREHRFIEIRTVQDLLGEYQCTIQDLPGFNQKSGWDGETKQGKRITLHIKSYSGISSVKMDTRYHMYQLPSGECFSDLTSNCCLDVCIDGNGFQLNISPHRDITWKEI